MHYRLLLCRGNRTDSNQRAWRSQVSFRRGGRRRTAGRGPWLHAAAGWAVGDPAYHVSHHNSPQTNSTMRLKIIRNARIKSEGKFHSCMVSKLRIIFKRIVILILQRDRKNKVGCMRFILGSSGLVLRAINVADHSFAPGAAQAPASAPQ